MLDDRPAYERHVPAQEWFDAHATHVTLDDLSQKPSRTVLALHVVAGLCALGSVAALVYVGVLALAQYRP